VSFEFIECDEHAETSVFIVFSPSSHDKHKKRAPMGVFLQPDTKTCPIWDRFLCLAGFLRDYQGLWVG